MSARRGGFCTENGVPWFGCVMVAVCSLSQTAGEHQGSHQVRLRPTSHWIWQQHVCACMHLWIYRMGDDLCIRPDEWINIIEKLLVLITPSSQRKAFMSIASWVKPAPQKTFILFCAAKPGSTLKLQKLKGFFCCVGYRLIMAPWCVQVQGIRVVGVVGRRLLRLVMTVQQ